MIVLNMTTDLRTFASTKVREFIRKYFALLLVLIKVFAKFCYMTAIILITPVLLVVYPFLVIGLTLWGECGWNKQLTLFQKTIFWIHVIGLTAVWWTLVVMTMAEYNFI
jgi:hypothetical protein